MSNRSTQRVTYNLAKKLKNLNFDLPCNVYVYIGDTGTGADHTIENLPSQAKNHNSDFLCISIPTYAEVFYWFRERYNVHSSPEKYSETQWWVTWGTWTSPVFDIFEDAEHAWLEKLIEITEDDSIKQNEVASNSFLKNYANLVYTFGTKYYCALKGSIQTIGGPLEIDNYSKDVLGITDGWGGYAYYDGKWGKKVI